MKMNKMTADEMYEKIGYKAKDPEKNVYIKNKYELICFENNDKRSCFKTGDVINLITMPELQAINKKCEELGWI